ncbi:hypothetical protein [Bifidobacterium choerinum]|uniref:hypothetical protein n=1 Tax=Bifidobacterium choerinum TaxID=35760 RepID=UPI0012FDF0B4|nr:hypothetical protein [Bifidobacterium choerinum]
MKIEVFASNNEIKLNLDIIAIYTQQGKGDIMKNKNLSITAIAASIILTFPQSAFAAQHKPESN